MNIKKIKKILLENLTFENFDKCLKAFDSGMRAFNKGIDDFTRELSSDVKDSNERSKSEAKKNQENLNTIFGSSKSNVKIWSDKNIRLM